MSKTIFMGAATALITPFKQGKTDFSALQRIIDFQIGKGIAALVVCGTTGECATLCEEEKKALFEFAVKASCGRVPIIAGTGSNDTSLSCRLSRAALECGCDGILCVTPYYNKASERGIYEHYLRIKESAASLPMILYNVPSRTGVDVPVSALKRLGDDGIIQGIKEASGNISKVADIVRTIPTLDVYSGNDDQILPILALGGKGVISVISNALPEKTQKICELYFSSKTSAALEAQLECLPLIRLMFEDVNPIPIKYLMHLLGFCENEYRLPLTPPDEKLKKKLEKACECL